MNRALAALALSTGLAAAGAASAQAYQQPYPDRGYGDQSYGQQPSYGQGYDRSEQDRGYQQPYDSRYDQNRGYYDQNRGYQGSYDNNSGYAAPRYESRTYTTPTYPDRSGDDRRYDQTRAVDPVPGATRPYVGVGPQRFYDVEDRIARMQARMPALPAYQRRRAYAEMRSIIAEERTQRDRHGGQLRDWDREHLNARLNALASRYPGLRV